MSRCYTRVLSFMMALCLLVSLVPVSASAADSATVTIDGTVQYSQAFALLEAINVIRREKGMNDLVMEQEMLDAAVLRSAELAVRFRLYRPNGDVFYTAYPLQGGYNATEVFDANYNNEQFINRYKDSALFEAEYRSSGISVFTHNGKNYTLVFLSYLEGTPATQPEDQTITREIEIGTTEFTVSLLGESDMEAGTQQELTVRQANLDKKYYYAIWNNDSLNWSSNNPAVATVHDGVITALSAGTAEITMTAGANTASFTVTVTGEAVHTHTMAYVEGKAPTYYEDGRRDYWVCTVCDRMYVEEAAVNELTAADLVIPMLTCTEHAWDSGVVTVASTSSKEGNCLYTCINCSAEENRPVPVNGKTPMHSGDLTRAKPTWQQLTDHINAVTNTSARFVEGEEPSVTAPYKAGKVTDELLSTGLSYLNYIRYAAGLPDVKLSEAWTESAQYGATVLGAIDELTHWPKRPADMDEAFHSKGYEATSTSNISLRYNDGSNGNPLHSSIQGCMDDSTSWQNLSGVGHRRWLLDPTLNQVGFGYAKSVQGNSYITTKVFENGINQQRGPDISYDFVSWPASGNMTSNVFGRDVPWSISLNPERYSDVNEDTIKISLTRVADNTVWLFDKNTSGPDVSEKQYLSLSSEGYGSGECIIFSPGSENIHPRYEGTYLVSVEGLQYVDGSPASLYYEVEFRSIRRCQHANTVTTPAIEPTCEDSGLTAGTKCNDCGVVLTVQEVVPALGHKMQEVSAGVEATCTAAGKTAVQICANHCGKEEGGEIIPIKGHSFNNGVCTVCGAESCTDHESVVVPGYEATCTEPGMTDGSKCGKCGKVLVQQQEIKKLGHKTELKNVKAATCTAKGYSGDEVCRRCNVTVTYGKEINVTAHSYKNGNCSKCGAKDPGYVPVVNNPFVDVSSSDYYYEPVMWAVANGITAGVSENSFAPEAPCTRAQIVTFLWRYFDSPGTNAANPFWDVPNGAWFKDAVLWAVDKNITSGVGAGQFGPDQPCTRGQVVTFLWRAAGSPEAATSNNFVDVADSAYYSMAVRWAVENGITSGVGGGCFGPDQSCTRGQIVTFLYRYANS